MPLPLKPPFPPMEALHADELPTEGPWQYEPKWDGFRCIAFRGGDRVELQSKAGQPLTRYFPDVLEVLRKLKATKFVFDGELVVPVEDQLSFDDLLQRIHPAESRIRKLSTETPAVYVIFDLLVDDRGRALTEQPLSVRRPALETFARKFLNGTVTRGAPSIRLSPATTSIKTARGWFNRAGHALDGVIAKRLDVDYRSGDRTGMLKVKQLRTIDCVVAGFRYGSKATNTMGSVLLGLYDDDGLLHHVGFCSTFTARDREKLTPQFETLKQSREKGGGFSGRAPGGPSRWSTERSGEWESLAPKLVIEVQYDHFTGGRFRHGTRFVRWRPDKAAKQCTMDQLLTARPSLKILDMPKQRARPRRAAAR